MDTLDEEMRARIEAVALPAGIRLVRIPDDDWHTASRSVLVRAFADRTWIERDQLHDEGVRAATRPLVERERLLLRHRYGLVHEGQLVGVYEGHQRLEAIYEMNITAIVPEHQRKGIYRALLRTVVEAARAAGFLAITSRHAADNNAILIPKLAEGFVIEGTIVSLSGGLQVRLVKYLHASGVAAFRRATSVP
ncbi:MAG: GNAT family N-acetyltransferase [Sandaracinaceae bacterium]